MTYFLCLLKRDINARIEFVPLLKFLLVVFTKHLAAGEWYY
jgi:hypothetical protein